MVRCQGRKAQQGRQEAGEQMKRSPRKRKGETEGEEGVRALKVLWYAGCWDGGCQVRQELGAGYLRGIC